MYVKMIKQSEKHSLYVIYTDENKAVGRIYKDGLITADEAIGESRKFEDDHPELFREKEQP